MLNESKIKKATKEKAKVKVNNRIKDIVNEGPLAQYLRQIDKVDLLTRDEETRLAKLAFEGDQDAREKLIKANLRFVVNIAKKYQKRGLPLIDLINEGNMGLITAADKFDYRRGYHFISYAVWWIKQAILKALSEKTRLIRLPLNRANQLMQIEKFRKEKAQSQEGELSNKDIADALGIDKESVANIINASREYRSFDAPIMYDKKERYLSEIIKDTSFAEPEEKIVDDALREAIGRVLETLTDKEKAVIRYRYGLDGSEPKSLKEIGKKFNLTKERIRQIEKKALKRLRHPSRSEELKAFLVH
jgi:RNA polymerase primary sigma factor